MVAVGLVPDAVAKLVVWKTVEAFFLIYVWSNFFNHENDSRKRQGNRRKVKGGGGG